jgi:hypothetical protein
MLRRKFVENNAELDITAHQMTVQLIGPLTKLNTGINKIIPSAA